mgnify:FL=1
MALGDGGLDAQVEQRMDTYRGNPTQLQKRYGQSKELLDLLALQKLTAEKKEVAAAMQLEQAQQPGTIAEQRETEALELVKQEQAGTLGELQARTSATLGQKQKMQGRGMQKIAQGAGRPPQQAGGIAGLTGGQPARPPMPPQGGPQAAGLPNARMMQAARGGPVRRMAGGGIVGFATGEEVEAGSAVRDRIAALGITAETFAAMPEAQRKSVLDSINDRAAIGQFGSGTKNIPAALYDLLITNPVAGFKNIVTDFSESRLGGALGLSDPTADPAERSPTFETLSGVQDEIADNEASLTEQGLKSLLPPGVEAFGGDDVPVVIPPTAALPPVDPEVREDTGNADEIPAELLGLPPQKVKPLVSTLPDAIQTLGQIDTTPMDSVNDMSGDVALRKGTAFSDDYLNRDANNQSFEDMKTRLSEFDKENYSPKEDLNNFLIGMGGTGSMGEAMKGGKAAMDKSRTNRRNRMVDEFLMEESRMDMDAGLGKAGLILGTSMSKDAQANERNMITVFNSMTQKQMDIAAKDADRIATRESNLLVSTDRKLQRHIDLLRVKNQSIEIKQKAATQVLTEINITRDALRLAEETTGPESDRLRSAGDELADATEDGSPRRIAAAEAEVAAIRARIYAAVESVLNQRNDAGQSRLELETLANQVFQDTLTMPTLTGSISGVRD